MHRAFAVSAAVLVAIVVSFSPSFASSGGVHGGVSAPRGLAPAVHPAALASIQPTDANGYLQFTFYPGLYGGRIYFTATDTADKTATVTVTDQNASRDHLTTPVASWTVTLNNVTGENISSNWGGFYQLPYNLSESGWWNLSINGQVGGSSSVGIYVDTYWLDAYSDSSAYLAGHTATVHWVVLAQANDAPLGGVVTSLQYNGEYTNSTGAFLALGGGTRTLTVSVFGNFSVTIPAAAVIVYLSIWANQTTAGGTASSSSSVTLYVGQLAATTVRLSTCPGNGCGSSSDFANGSLVFATFACEVVAHEIFGTYYGTAPDLSVRLTWYNNKQTVTSVPGSPPTTLTTNASGGVQVVFQATAAAFNPAHMDQLTVNVTDPLDSANTLNVSSNFHVEAPSAYGIVRVTLDSAVYYGGDTATAFWQLGGNGSAAPAGWSAQEWIAYLYPYTGQNTQVIAEAAITGTADSGTLSVPIPLGETGTVYVEVLVFNATEEDDGSAGALVSQPIILLTPSVPQYLPGETVTITVGTVGKVLAQTPLWGEATANSGVILWVGTVPSSNVITLHIPALATPTGIQIYVAAQNATLGTIASAETSIEESSAYILTASVTTTSTYSDGSFQPGQTVDVHYNIGTLYPEAITKAYTLYIFPFSELFSGGARGELEAATQGSSGTVSYTIPSFMSNGQQLFFAEIEFAGCAEFTPTCTVTTTFSVLVNNAPSFLSYSIGAGSGFTVGWLLVIIVILILVLVAYMLVRRRNRMRPPPPLTAYSAGGSGSASGSSAAAAPASPPKDPSTWTESANDSQKGGNPPLPTPPPR